MRTVLKVTKSIIERKKRGRRHDKKRNKRDTGNIT